MDKIELYRASIQALLQEHDRHLLKNNNDDVENELFFDVERDSPIGDALRSISTNAGGMAGIEKSVLHYYALRYQRWKNLDSAEHD